MRDAFYYNFDVRCVFFATLGHEKEAHYFLSPEQIWQRCFRSRPKNKAEVLSKARVHLLTYFLPSFFFFFFLLQKVVHPVHQTMYPLATTRRELHTAVSIRGIHLLWVRELSLLKTKPSRHHSYSSREIGLFAVFSLFASVKLLAYALLTHLKGFSFFLPIVLSLLAIVYF